ncbi:MAG: lytic murein transglycosylase B [Pseudomonadota bacterium]
MRFFLAVTSLLLSTLAQAGYDGHPRASELLQQLAARHGFSAVELDWVRGELTQAQPIPKLIESEQQAKEKTLSWTDYRRIHVTRANIDNGQAFMRKYRKSLARAEAQYGVPREVIAAILGVETKYGVYAATTRVLDALATQGFDHPTRSDFFFNELVEFFALCRDRDFDPQLVRGSYAGAMGAAQFMPSNYRRLAVDFNADGKTDLWNLQDAIGSIARYLTEYDPARRWQPGQPAVAPATFDDDRDDLEINARYARSSVAELAEAGLRGPEGLQADLPAGALELITDEGSEWWIGLPNFFAVMSYNPRVYYAMSVTQLAQALESE